MFISVIIPTLGHPLTVKKVLDAVCEQTLQPDEIVIIDSSTDDAVENLSFSYKESLPIKYHRVNSLFPGEARNYGINKSSGNIIATLDSKTIPKKDWLKASIEKINSNEYEISFGSTSYIANLPFQKILRACIYGKKAVQTLPGSVFSRDTFYKVGTFAEGTRSGEDLEWRNRAKKKEVSIYTHQESTLIYNDISINIFQEIKRAFIYQLHGAKLDVQLRTRIVIFGIGVLMITLLIPQWNNLVGWESSKFYIANITKSYFYFLSIFTMISLALFHKFNTVTRNLWFRFLFLSIFILSSYFVFKWNAAMANWVEESVYYIPHITKIYLSILFLSGIFFRGLYIPISRGISLTYLFPMRWMIVGLVGTIIDLAKFPGYFIGAISGIVRLGK
jgi:glycosyltransferase involved in cell wall biosynthesis